MNNQNSIGIILLLLLALGAREGSGAGAGTNGRPVAWGGSGQSFVPEANGAAGVSGGPGANGRPPFRPPHPATLAKDFHRMVGVMGKVDNLGQMALKPPPAPKLPKSDEPESLINASALPDLSGILDMLGPIMSGLGGSGEK